MEKETISMGLNNFERLVEVREFKMGLDTRQVGIWTGVGKGEGRGRRAG